MSKHKLSTIAVALLFSLCLPTFSQTTPTKVILGGEVGHAASRCANRFLFAPFNSLPWLRADLTGEQASEFDEADWGNLFKRPFKNYSGDISGRFIEIMALRRREGFPPHPAFEKLLSEIPAHQRPGGYFCASGVIDWDKPIDHHKQGDPPLSGRMLPALWGNARLLCGLIASIEAFPENKTIAQTTRRLADFYIAVLPRFNDPKRIAEYTAGGTFAAGYVTCWFPAMEGLVKYGNLTGEKEYIDAAEEMAAFYKQFDTIPVDHSHGMLCNQVALLLLHEATGKAEYLERVEERWEQLVEGGYINPAGGILEKCRISFGRDEGCAIVDWLRLNFELGHRTGKARYWQMAERTLHNHFLQNQHTKGGFGHRYVLFDDTGVQGFKRHIAESTWCCTYHGELGFIQLRKYVVARTDKFINCRFALDFEATDSAGTITSVLRFGIEEGEVLRQRFSLTNQPATVIRLRRPRWADGVSAIDPMGTSIELHESEGWVSTSIAVNEVEFIYKGGLYAENTRCERLSNGPMNQQLFVIGYGPKLLAHHGEKTRVVSWPTDLKTLAQNGIHPLASTMRNDFCQFVFKSKR